MMIADLDFVVLKRDSFMRVVQAKKNGRPIILDKTKFYLDNIFGKPYGSQFEVDKKSAQFIQRDQDFSIEGLLPGGSSGLDNRNLISANEDNQNLGKEEIHALRKDGLTGDEVMTELIKNSSTFNQKTKFSQEKWIKKKKKRHMNVYTILKPCTRLIAEMHYQRDPAKICFLRMDSLAQILTMSNVHTNSKVLLVESCQGLIAGAILNRLSDDGCLTQFFTGPNPMKGRTAFDDFGFSKLLAKSRMKLYPLNELHKLSLFCKSRSATPPMDMSSSTEVAAKRTKLADDEGAETSTSATNIPSPPMIDAMSPNSTQFDYSSCQNVDKISNNDNIPNTEKVTSCSTLEASGVTDTKETSGVTDTKEAELTKDECNLGSSDQLTDLVTANGKRVVEEDRVEIPIHLQERRAAKEYIENTKFDTLVVAIKSQPAQVVLRLLTLLKMSRPFVVFHQYKEPLMELFVQLKERGGIVNLKLTETWFRTIQVLPERTHPAVNMSGTSGYLLTGTIVQTS